MKNVAKQKNRRAFIEGMSRAFDLFGISRSKPFCETRSTAQFERNDNAAIQKDWSIIGQGFYLTIAAYAKKHGLKND